MKAPLLLLAAAMFVATAASAQTPGSATQPNTSNPAAVPSGTAPVQANPKGDVSPSEVFTKGSASEERSVRGKNMMKDRKMKDGKMKRKMNTTM